MVESVSEEVAYDLPHLTLRGLFWRQDQLKAHKKLYLGIHGWVDNAASFEDLFSRLDGPALALDMAGHGRSDHRPLGSGYALWDYGIDVHVLLKQFGFDEITVIGHSMGSAVAATLALLNPERVRKVVFIDGFGPLSDPPESWAESFVKAVEHRTAPHRFQQSYIDDGKTFKSLGDAVAARQRSQYQKLDAVRAEQLLKRGLTPSTQDSSVTLSTDPRITHPSTTRMTEMQVKSLLEGITQPVLTLFGEDGYFKDEPRERISWMKNIKAIKVPGDHYPHLGPHVERVLDEVSRF